MGLVLVHLVWLRPNHIHARRIDLRAANSNYPVGVSSVYCPRFSFSLSFSPFCPGSRAGCLPLVGVCARVLVRLFWLSVCLLFFPSLCLLPAVDLCVRLGSRLLSLLPAVKPLARPLVSLSLSLFLLVFSASRVSRQILTLTGPDHVQFSPPVDLCVRELSPPLSILSWGLWHADENLLPSCHAR